MNPEVTVHVSNISIKANTKTVSDFFSFCGRIVNLYLKNDQNGLSQQAIVVFESDSAAKTALLLTNALIVDKVIQVVPFSPALELEFQQQISSNPINSQQQGENQFTSQPEEDIVNRNHSVPDNERTKTSVIASVIAAGYSVGQDAVIKARQVDDEHNISLTLKVGAEAVKAKANEIDNKLHISENAAVVKNVVTEKANQIDQRFQISSMFKSAGDFISQQTNAFVTSVNENPTISPVINKVSNFGTYIKQEVQQVQDETSRAIDEKNREKGIVDNNNNNNNNNNDNNNNNNFNNNEFEQPINNYEQSQQQDQQNQSQQNYSEM